MGFWSNIFGSDDVIVEETRSIEGETVETTGGITVDSQSGEENLDLALRGEAAKTEVTREQALQIPAVSVGVNLLSNSIASIPIRLFKKDKEKIIEIVDDSRIKLLNLDTNSVLGAYETKNAMVRDLLLEGTCYCYLGKSVNNVINIQYVPKEKVSLMDNQKTIDRVIKYLIDGDTYNDFNMLRVVRNSDDGVRGRGILKDNKVILSTMYNALSYENSSMVTGGKKGFLKSEGRLSKKMLDALKTAWKTLYSNNKSDVIVLNKGLSFEAADSTAVENQLNENKTTNTGLLYKIFGFTEETFTNEEAFRVYVKIAVSPIAKSICEALNRSLLLESEKGIMYFKFDMNDLLSADMLSRFQAYQVALASHWIGIDEIRAKEDLSPLGIDFVGLGLNDVLYQPETRKVFVPNTGKASVLNWEGGEPINEGGDTE